MNFPKSFYTALSEDTLFEVKGGTKRDSFLEIWMVEVDNRVFARSWSKSERSWFTAFLEEGQGEIRYRGNVLKVEGIQVNPTDPVHSKINQAYLLKYTQEGNRYYAEGITQPQYVHYTLEFKPI